MDKSKICFIRAMQKDDYVVSAIQKYGYKIIIPYKDYNLLLRICREFWFRLKFPHREVWYNSEIKRIKEEIIIVKDPLIVPEFIEVLRKLHKEKTIIMDYDNRVDNSINPNTIRTYVDVIWHYDKDDCNKYKLRYKNHAYLDVYQVKPNLYPQYDVFYVGRDKGRLNQIDRIKINLEEAGLKTYFHICANRKFLTWTNKKYKHFLPYTSYLELLKKSRAILNIVPEGQKSITMREMEAVFDGIKCITNNLGIVDFPFYNESRFYLIQSNDSSLKDIDIFLNTPFIPIPVEELEEYRFDNRLLEMLEHLKR